MSEDLEFHYVVSYREGFGFDIAVDTETALFNEGTIYDWDTNSWIFPSNVESGKDVEDIDLHHYRMLKYALAQINNLRIEQLIEEQKSNSK